MRDLVLRTRNGNAITRLLRVRKCDLAIPLLLQLFDLRHALDDVPLVQAINVYSLIDELSIRLFNHIHDLLLNELEILRVASRRAADDVVDLYVFIVTSVRATVHGVGELDEDRISLHNSLDVLATNADDALVVLIWNVE